MIFEAPLESQKVFPISLTILPDEAGAVLVILPAVVDIYKGSPDFKIVAQVVVSTNPLISMEIGPVGLAELTQIPNIWIEAAAGVEALAKSQVSFCVL